MLKRLDGSIIMGEGKNIIFLQKKIVDGTSTFKKTASISFEADGEVTHLQKTKRGTYIAIVSNGKIIQFKVTKSEKDFSAIFETIN